MNQLELENFTFGYRKSLTAHPLNLACGAAGVPFSLGLWGANGAGKTTCLKTLAGLMKPLTGRVLWKSDLQLAFVPQELGKNFFVPISVREVLVQMSRVGTGDDFNRIVHAMELDLILSKTWEELYRGQKQKVIIERALMKMPDVLLLDEPFSALDQDTSEKIQHFLTKFKKEKSLILIDHQYERLQSVTDKMLTL